jgi:hypothetical protein
MSSRSWAPTTGARKSSSGDPADDRLAADEVPRAMATGLNRQVRVHKRVGSQMNTSQLRPVDYPKRSSSGSKPGTTRDDATPALVTSHRWPTNTTPSAPPSQRLSLGSVVPTTAAAAASRSTPDRRFGAFAIVTVPPAAVLVGDRPPTPSTEAVNAARSPPGTPGRSGQTPPCTNGSNNRRSRTRRRTARPRAKVDNVVVAPSMKPTSKNTNNWCPRHDSNMRHRLLNFWVRAGARISRLIGLSSKIADGGSWNILVGSRCVSPFSMNKR